MSTPVLPTPPIAPVNAPVNTGIPPVVEPTHPGFVRNSPSGELISVAAPGSAYQNIQVNGVPLPSETTLNLTGAGVAGSDVGGVTTANFTNPPPEAITSFATNPTLYLVGASSVNQAFTASYADPPTTAVLTDTEGNTDNVIGSPGAFVSPHTVTKTAYGSSVTYTLTITSPEGPATANVGIVWGQNVYFGSAVDPGGAGYNAAFIQGLGGTVLKLGAAGAYGYNTGAGASAFFAARTAFGLTVANFTVNGFPFACSRVATNVPITVNGVTENFDLFRSDNTGLGEFTLVEA